MAKIDDMIHEMEIMLDSNDLSNTPQGRQLAESYAAVCREINDALAECASMFRMGAYSEARRLNLRAQPPLTARWKVLNFPKRGEWINLCSLYHWAIPPELDTETVKKLMDTDSAEVEVTIEELQNQWRRIIRDGSMREKLLLARRIYSLDPTAASKSNLINMERPWIHKLKTDANNAFAEKRVADLAEICRELTSDELLTKVSGEELKKYQPLLEEFEKEELQKEKIQILQSVADCYAAMLLPELKEALSAWAKLEKNPLFTISEEEKIQISDAKNFYREQQAQINERERFESLQNQLEQLLIDQTAAPEEIDRVYRSLQLFDRPINPILESQFSDFQERDELDKKRRHIRKCVKLGASAAAIAILVFTVIFFVHREVELRRDAAKIREMLSSRHFDSALKYCEKIAQERPATAKRATIIALKKEAENMLADSITAKKIFDDTCTELEKKYLNPENILAPAVDELFAILEEKAKLMPETESAVKDELLRRCEALRQDVYKNNDLAFLKEVSVIAGKWNSFLGNLNNIAENEAKITADTLHRESTALLNKFRSKVSPGIFTAQEKNFSGNYTMAKDKLRQLLELQDSTRSLLFPTSIDQYADALSKIHTISSQLAGNFSAAARQFPREKQLYSLQNDLPSCFSAAAKYPESPFLRDIKNAGNPPFFAGVKSAGFKSRLDAMKSELQQPLFELKFPTGENRLCHLYFNDPEKNIEVESSWGKNRFKAVKLSFIRNAKKFSNSAVFVITPDNDRKTEPGDEEQKYILHRPAGQIADYLPVKLLPENAGFLKDPSSLPVSTYHRELKKVIGELENCNGYTDVLNLIISIAENKELTNVCAKAELLKKLLSLLPDTPAYYSEAFKPLKELISTFTEGKSAGCWMDPALSYGNTETVVFQEKLNSIGLRKIIGTLIFTDMAWQYACMNHPIPAGVIYFDSNGKWRMHSFASGINVLKQPEVVIHCQSEKTNLLDPFSFVPMDFATPQTPDKIKSELKSRIYNGQLIFVQPNNDSFSAALKKIVKVISDAGCPLPDADSVKWPGSWPENLRYIPGGEE
ncbi:MAG: hypothetical protein IJW33_05865 [Lentisphaeria bacterium]|nr:hypothetical protein [Lentisphaeria bacterium]